MDGCSFVFTLAKLYDTRNILPDFMTIYHLRLYSNCKLQLRDKILSKYIIIGIKGSSVTTVSAPLFGYVII